MTPASIWDIETLALPDEVILANLPPWDEQEARTRVPKNYKKEEAVNGWLEEDKANYGKDVLEKAALNPEMAKIAISAMIRKGNVYQLSLEDFSEAELVQTIMEDLRVELGKGTPILGWNIYGFDLPFLLRRAWIIGIEVPSVIYTPLSRYPVSDRFIDMMDRWKGGNFKAPHTSLRNALKACDLGDKPDGGTFAKLWHEDIEKALNYSRLEIIGQQALYRRMGVDV